jgi:hypothetical protein
MLPLGPRGEVRRGVAVSIYGQAAPVAAVRDPDLPAVPRLLVDDLPGEFCPARIGDGAGQVLVANQVGDGEVLQRQPVVGLDELAGDLMQEASTDIGDASVLLGQAAGNLGAIVGVELGARRGPAAPP